MSTKNKNLDEISLSFIRRTEERKLRIGIVGMGYVGLPLAKAFITAGFRVVGFDIDASKVSQLQAGQTYIKHIPSEQIQEMNATGLFSATTNFSGLEVVDAILICVPTPLNEHRDPDLSYVEATTKVIVKHLQVGQLIALESTTYPGTSEEIMLPVLESSGLSAGRDFAIAYSPEREDPGNPDFGTATIPKIVGANTKAESAMACAMYRAIVSDVVEVSDLKTAEAVKLTENIFRAVNIALVNELKIVYSEMGIDVWEVIKAADTKPFGFMAFYPGPGLGGHCIPIDPFYLTWKAKEFGLNTRFIELAGEINSKMPEHVIMQMLMAMNDKLGLAMKNTKVLVIGMAYKKNVDDMRESPSLELVEILKKRGAEVSYYDPFIPVTPLIREYPTLAGMRSIDWTAEALKKFDVALIATDHCQVDYELLVKNMPLIIDTRNALVEFQSDNIVKA